MSHIKLVSFDKHHDWERCGEAKTSQTTHSPDTITPHKVYQSDNGWGQVSLSKSAKQNLSTNLVGAEKTFVLAVSLSSFA